MKKISVIIADDHKLLRESLVILLQRENNIEVIGEAENGRDALEKTIKLKPDIVILDISLPLLNGLEVAAQLKGMPETKVIILTMHKNEDYIAKAYRAGVAAYLLKENALEELLYAINVVTNGGIYISDKIAATVISGFIQNFNSTGQPKEILSPREKEVLQMLAEGYPNKDIAEKLNVSLKTVETHRANIMRKMDFHNITDLILYAVRNNIIVP